MRVVSDRVNPNNFYSFNPETGQILVSFNAAQSFGALSTPVSAPGNDVEIAPTPGITANLWIAAGHKLFHSTDSGSTFVTLEGMTDVHHVSFGANAPGKPTPSIYVDGTAAGTEGLFRSDDEGRTWLRIDDPTHQFGWRNSITGDARIFGRIYLATGGRGILYGDPQTSTASTTTNH
jgi:hypothetical protein